MRDTRRSQSNYIYSLSPQIIAQATALNIMLDETSISIEHITGQQMQDTHVEQPLAGDAHHDVVWRGLGQHVDVFEAWTNSDGGCIVEAGPSK